MDDFSFDASDLGDVPLDGDLSGGNSGFDAPPPNDIPPVVEFANEFDTTEELQPNLLEPGPFATDSISARGPEQTFTEDERLAIDAIGYDSGCHSCGTFDPGTVSGHFVPDHQPPTALNEDDVPQELYPQCLDCSRQQGGQIRAAQMQNELG